MAGIYDYINRFWTEAERSPFNPTEVALYHYLLYEAHPLHAALDHQAEHQQGTPTS